VSAREPVDALDEIVRLRSQIAAAAERAPGERGDYCEQVLRPVRQLAHDELGVLLAQLALGDVDVHANPLSDVAFGWSSGTPRALVQR
jgi:hypothetical protein